MVIKLKSVLFPCFKAMLFCECSLQLCSLGVDENGHKQFGFSRNNSLAKATAINNYFSSMPVLVDVAIDSWIE